MINQKHHCLTIVEIKTLKYQNVTANHSGALDPTPIIGGKGDA